MRLISRTLAVLLLILAPAAYAADAPPQTITLASTTSVDNSGLLQAILPGFTKATNISVKVLAQGTGQALDTARRGDADIVLVHDPEAEQKFIDDGNGVNLQQIAWNDFIMVGPGDDPAHIAGGHDAIMALTAIATKEANFVSRGDKSGTNALELRLWKRAGIDPKSGAGGWYKDIGGGMGAALNAAAAMPVSAALALWPPATCAGSSFGPTRMKSFQAICWRLIPSPSSMNFCSASGSWTRTMSASPRRAVSSA
jgi:tungstate transport system substrate-binding protein